MVLAVTGPWGLTDRDRIFRLLTGACGELAAAGGGRVTAVLTLPGGPFEALVSKWAAAVGMAHVRLHHSPRAVVQWTVCDSVWVANRQAVARADALLVLPGTMDRQRTDLIRRFAAAGKDVYDADDSAPLHPTGPRPMTTPTEDI